MDKETIEAETICSVCGETQPTNRTKKSLTKRRSAATSTSDYSPEEISVCGRCQKNFGEPSEIFPERGVMLGKFSRNGKALEAPVVLRGMRIA